MKGRRIKENCIKTQDAGLVLVCAERKMASALGSRSLLLLYLPGCL